jgi:hypothetical protein
MLSGYWKYVKRYPSFLLACIVHNWNSALGNIFLISSSSFDMPLAMNRRGSLTPLL